VVRLDTLITTTREKLIGAAQNYIESLNARVAALDAIAGARAEEVGREQPATEAQEALLLQKVEALSKMSNQLNEEYQKARMAEEVEAGHVDIVDLAPLPAATVGVGRTRKLAVGLLLGMILGTGIAYLIENLNTSIRRRSDMESLLHIPGLAVIPQSTNGAAKGARPVRRIAAWRNGATRNGGSSAPASDGLITVSSLASSSAEAYRTLRTNLLFSQVVQRLKTIVITSTSPGDGKTTISTNLSVTFAQQGLRVLLIDCDLRRARVHQVFGVPRAPGLTELVMEYNVATEAIIATPVEGLFMLPAGRLPPNPAELLGGLRMRGLLETLAKDFDLVILDSPPVLAASDAAILGSMADGVLMVVRAGQTDRDAAREALKQLATVGARVVGAVLNDPDASVPQYAEFYEYASTSS
jgi:succinoglycan biosynthesis transport protein ExoP